MKKFCIKVIAFILVFVIALLMVQDVLHYRWPEDTRTRYVDYSKNPKDSIDAFIFGTSEIYAAYAPVAGYHASGFTAYNFGIQNRSAMTTYYQLKYALKYQTPKVVMCDFVCLFDSMLPTESETVYRRTVETLPDLKIKSELINEVCRVDKNQNAVSWYFPVLRYHSMWDELSDSELYNDRAIDKNYEGFKKGVNLKYTPFEGEPYDIVPELWEDKIEPAELADFSVYYYDKFIEECHNRGIEVVCVLTPKVSDAAVYKANFPAMKEYFDSRGVKYINYCTYEDIQKMGLNMYDDYADPAHLNAVGTIKFTTVCSNDIKEMFDLPDRRLDKDSAVTQAWDGFWNDMVIYYAGLSRD